MSKQRKVPVLHRASSRGDSDQIRDILEKSSNVNQKAGPFDETSLHIAAGQGHADVVEMLLKAGASVFALDSFERIPAMLAAKNGHDRPLKFLMDAVTKDEETEEEAQKAMKKVLELRDLSGKTILHFAADGGSLHCIKRLLKLGADMQATDENKRTALHLSSAKGHTRVVEYLLAHGAELTAKDDHRHTALYHASYRSRKATSMSIIQRGTSPRIRSKAASKKRGQVNEEKMSEESKEENNARSIVAENIGDGAPCG